LRRGWGRPRELEGAQRHAVADVEVATPVVEGADQAVRVGAGQRELALAAAVVRPACRAVVPGKDDPAQIWPEAVMVAVSPGR
jgi:hypothetical protein